MIDVYVMKYIIAMVVTISIGVWRKASKDSKIAEFVDALFVCMGAYWLFELIVNEI